MAFGGKKAVSGGKEGGEEPSRLRAHSV